MFKFPDMTKDLEKLISEWENSPYQDSNQDTMRYCASKIREILKKYTLAGE
jgi:hypothetical protein